MAQGVQGLDVGDRVRVSCSPPTWKTASSTSPAAARAESAQEPDPRLGPHPVTVVPPRGHPDQGAETGEDQRAGHDLVGVPAELVRRPTLASRVVIGAVLGRAVLVELVLIASLSVLQSLQRKAIENGDCSNATGRLGRDSHRRGSEIGHKPKQGVSRTSSHEVQSRGPRDFSGQTTEQPRCPCYSLKIML